MIKTLLEVLTVCWTGEYFDMWVVLEIDYRSDFPVHDFSTVTRLFSPHFYLFTIHGVTILQINNT